MNNEMINIPNIFKDITLDNLYNLMDDYESDDEIESFLAKREKELTK